EVRPTTCRHVWVIRGAEKCGVQYGGTVGAELGERLVRVRLPAAGGLDCLVSASGRGPGVVHFGVADAKDVHTRYGIRVGGDVHITAAVEGHRGDVVLSGASDESRPEQGRTRGIELRDETPEVAGGRRGTGFDSEDAVAGVDIHGRANRTVCDWKIEGSGNSRYIRIAGGVHCDADGILTVAATQVGGIDQGAPRGVQFCDEHIRAGGV